MIDTNQRNALDATEGLVASPSNIVRLGKSFDVETVRWAFSQWSLRSRASKKFAEAHKMLFIREALEQATAESVAAYHASLFPEGVRVADLTAGIGGDLMALARRGPAIGFEIDPKRAEAADHNLSVNNLDAELLVEDSLAVNWDWEYAFADPARRVDGHRTINPEEFSPNTAILAYRFANLKLGIMKLTPLLQDSFLDTLGPSQRFISFDNECREVLVSAGELAKPEKLAVHIETGEVLEPQGDVSTVESPGAFFFDANPAAVRAHCLGTLATRHELLGLGDSRGYLTSDQLIESPWLRNYRVLYHGKADTSATKKRLHELDASMPEVKLRHAELDVMALVRALKCNGSRKLSLAIWPVGHSLRHTILEPAG